MGLSRRALLRLISVCLGSSYVLTFDVLARENSIQINTSSNFLRLSYYLTGFIKLNPKLEKYFVIEMNDTFGSNSLEVLYEKMEKCLSQQVSVENVAECLIENKQILKRILELWYLGNFKVSIPKIEIKDLAYKEALIWRALHTTAPCVPAIEDWSKPPVYVDRNL